MRIEAFRPNAYVTVEQEHLDKKVAAIACYASQVRQAPHPRSEERIRAMAIVRGQEAHSCMAEAYRVVRWTL